MFTTFKYYFAHWCAYNMTALNLGCWKFRFLFHDFEKPWLKLIFRDYTIVQKLHRQHSRHHIEYFLKNYNKKKDKTDYLGMMIDWECSRLTKKDNQSDCEQQLEKECLKLNGTQSSCLKLNMIPLMKKYGLYTPPSTIYDSSYNLMKRMDDVHL